MLMFSKGGGQASETGNMEIGPPLGRLTHIERNPSNEGGGSGQH